ncbi:MAG: ABC transporter permease [Rhodoplanes sp.]
MFFRILGRSFFEGRKRKFLAVVTIALAATLIMTLFGITVDVGDKMARELKSYGANIRVVPKSESVSLDVAGVEYNPLQGRAFLSEDDLPKIKDIFWRNNIIGLTPYLTTAAELDHPARLRVSLIGTYFNKRLPLPDDDSFRTGVSTTNALWKLDGAWPDDERSDAVLVGSSLARAAGLVQGSRLRVRRAGGDMSDWAEFEVSGILATGDAEDHAILAPLAAVQKMTGLDGKIQSIEVSALTVPDNTLSRKAQRGREALTTAEYDIWYCTACVSSIAHQIEEAVVNASARPIWQVAASEGAVISKIQLLMVVVTIAAFVSAAMGVSSVLNASVMERSREIGLMKALGAAQWQVSLLFLSEAAILGLVGGLVGCIFGAALLRVIGWNVFGAAVAVHWIAIPVVVFASVLTALAGSVMPARAIARLMPVETLYGRP